MTAPLALARARSPEETLAWLAPKRAPCGVTRTTPVTWLDTLGIPTWCAIRPNGLLLQVSNGKGLTDAQAECSALMESLELHHAEFPEPGRAVVASEADLAGSGARVVPPTALPQRLDTHYAPGYRSEWISGIDLGTGEEVWLPSSAVLFYRRPMFFETSSNGLAGGNTACEAALHALYELIERDAMTRLSVAGRLRIAERARVIDTATVDVPALADILDRAARAGTKVVLMALPPAVGIHAFWAVFLGTTAIAPVSTLNTGWGAHVDPAIAAMRALTEAAQSRLGFIHGGRDDLVRKPVHGAVDVKKSPAYRFFEALGPDTAWAEIAERPVLDLPGEAGPARDALVSALLSEGLGPVMAVDLTQAALEVPVIRLVAPRLGFRRQLF